MGEQSSERADLQESRVVGEQSSGSSNWWEGKALGEWQEHRVVNQWRKRKSVRELRDGRVKEKDRSIEGE